MAGRAGREMTRGAASPPAPTPRASVENHPPELSGKTPLPAATARRFTDAQHWDQLATAYLSRYDLPAWDVPYTPKATATWLDRLDLPLSAWLAVGNYPDVAEFAVLNPGWPLRAAIGLMLELRHERSGAA